MAATAGGAVPAALAEEDIGPRTTAHPADTETLEADVLVCGGGPSGMAAAVAVKSRVRPRDVDVKRVQAALAPSS